MLCQWTDSYHDVNESSPPTQHDIEKDILFSFFFHLLVFIFLGAPVDPNEKTVGKFSDIGKSPRQDQAQGVKSETQCEQIRMV